MLAGALLTRIVLVALVGTAAPASAAPTYRVEGSLTHATFAVPQLGFLKQRGHFERVWGTIVLDSARRTGSIDFILDAASVSTGWDARDEFIRGENMFDAAHFPSLRFRSTRLIFDGPTLRAVDGEFTLRGVTLPIRLEVKELRCSPMPTGAREACRAQVIGQISRAAFGMDYGFPLIGDEVELEFSVTALRVRDDETESP
jgi:polyisoprenoid-binding protein YceI